MIQSVIVKVDKIINNSNFKPNDAHECEGTRAVEGVGGDGNHSTSDAMDISHLKVNCSSITASDEQKR